MQNMEQNFRSIGSICALCYGEIHDPVSKPCGHSFCCSCFLRDRALRGNGGGSCPACISYREINEPLQLISVNENGLLDLNETTLIRCFLREGIEECPVYLISVIGESRTGKSFLMNYMMKALQNQERTNTFCLGAEDEILKGFTWKPGTDSVTNGIWILSTPFILEQNGQKIAVFLMDMEGSMAIDAERKANIKMSMLTMLLSSHLVFNVRTNIKEPDIDYLEIYCHGLGSDKLHNLKYFDFLIRDWHDPEKCEPKDGELHFDSIIERMKTRYKKCTFLKVLDQCSPNCFLMPEPGSTITSKETGRLKDMNKEFQESLRRYLSDVVNRVLSSIGSADSENTRTCSDMAQKIATEFLPFINEMKYNITSPIEMYNMKKNLETMQEIKNEFQVFLCTWPMWKLKIGNQVGDKISELYQKFESSYKHTNDEDRNDQLENLKTYLVAEGENFCKIHNVTLCFHGITAVAGLAAWPLTSVFAAAPAAAAATTFTQSILRWTWFGAKAAAPAAASSISTTSIIGGVTAVAQVGVAYVGKYLTNRGVTVAEDDPSTPRSPRCASSDTHSGKMN